MPNRCKLLLQECRTGMGVIVYLLIVDVWREIEATARRRRVHYPGALYRETLPALCGRLFEAADRVDMR